MATIKSFTDLSQSKILSKILPLDSADMFWLVVGNTPRVHVLTEPLSNYSYWENYPCWSLASLLGILPDEIIDDGDVYRNMFFHLKGRYIIQYPRLTTLWPSLLSVEADNPIDACVAMIEKLNELNLL